MTKQLNIRWMNSDDIDDWAQMAHALWPHTDFSQHRKEITTMIEGVSARRGAIASTADIKLAGFADIGIRTYADGCTNQPVLYLEGIWIDPQCRRQSIGRHLLEFVSRWAKSEGFMEICSDTDIKNLTSHSAHAAWGFSETSRITNFRKPLA